MHILDCTSTNNACDCDRQDSSRAKWRKEEMKTASWIWSQFGITFCMWQNLISDFLNAHATDIFSELSATSFNLLSSINFTKPIHMLHCCPNNNNNNNSKPTMYTFAHLSFWGHLHPPQQINDVIVVLTCEFFLLQH